MTAVSQPLDVGPNSALESKTKSLTHRWHGRPENAGGKLDQYSMMKHVVFHAVEEVFSNPNTVISAFRRTGIFPWRKLDPHQLKKLAPGTIFQHHHHQELFPDPGPSSHISPQNDIVVETAATPQVVADPVPVPSLDPSADLATEAPPDTATVSEEVQDTETNSVPISDDSPPTLSESLPTSSTPTPPMSREASSSVSSSASLPSSSVSSSFDSLVAEQKELTQEQKVWLLQRHELLLGPTRVRMFEDIYSKNLLHCPNTEFQCWLLMKQQAVGTEDEALERVISSRQPKNVPKKKTSRKLDLPSGGDRYDPLSKGYEEYFGRVAARKEGKRKVSVRDSPAELTTAPPTKTKKVKKTK